jgi:hypothetical protein
MRVHSHGTGVLTQGNHNCPIINEQSSKVINTPQNTAFPEPTTLLMINGRAFPDLASHMCLEGIKFQPYGVCISFEKKDFQDKDFETAKNHKFNHWTGHSRYTQFRRGMLL